MKVRSAQIVLSLVCVAFGILLMTQFRTQGKIAKTQLADSSADQAQIIANLYDANVNLRKEVDGLSRQLRDSDEAAGGTHPSELAADLQKFRVVNGEAAAIGPGVEMTITAEIRP